jgi:hypothetical protein
VSRARPWAVGGSATCSCSQAAALVHAGAAWPALGAARGRAVLVRVAPRSEPAGAEHVARFDIAREVQARARHRPCCASSYAAMRCAAFRCVVSQVRGGRTIVWRRWMGHRANPRPNDTPSIFVLTDCNGRLIHPTHSCPDLLTGSFRRQRRASLPTSLRTCAAVAVQVDSITR